MIKIFISHSGHDTAIAKTLAELFRTAMHLAKSEIRCTSVDGYRLPAGANTDEQLRREVLEAPVLVGLISHHSFESAYVLFELGARWGKNSFMAPVLAPGVSASVLKGPLSGFNTLSCSSASQVHQLVHDVAQQLAASLEPAAAYQELVELVTSYSSGESTASSTSQPHPRPKSFAPPVEDDYAASEDIIARHCESQWGDDYRMRLHCEDQQRSAVEQLRHQSHTDVPSEVFGRIRTNSARQWPDDFQMRLHTENEQLDAFRKLHG
jgi:hypothetical protein